MTSDLDAKSNEPRLYVFFGKSCAGKSYVARALAAHIGISFLEGDAHLTAAMKRCIDRGVPFSDEIRSEYYLRLEALVRARLASHGRLALAQAFFHRRHRDMFRAAFPGARFLLVEAPDLSIAGTLS